jgi:dihydroflavonol-4-reductase
MDKIAFVTGSTGFLGLNLIEELQRQQWKIIAFHVADADLKYLSRFDVIRKEGNLNDLGCLLEALPQDVDAIFHTAGNTSMWSKNNQQQFQDNVIGTQNLVVAAMQRKARKFIYTSSVAAYGYHKNPVTEATPSNALTSKMNYNITKYLAEQSVKEAVTRGLPAVILNPINIIGPYDVNNWTRQFVRPIYYNQLPAIPPGRAMWCHVGDVVDAHIKAVVAGVIGENYLLGGVEASFKDVVNEIEKLLGKKQSTRVQPPWVLKVLTILLSAKSMLDGKEPMLTPEKYRRAVGCITCNYRKAEQVLEYKTSSLETMIKDSYAWLKRENLLPLEPFNG